VRAVSGEVVVPSASLQRAVPVFAAGTDAGAGALRSK
jgi:hypothetical protein